MKHKRLIISLIAILGITGVTGATNHISAKAMPTPPTAAEGRLHAELTQDYWATRRNEDNVATEINQDRAIDSLRNQNEKEYGTPNPTYNDIYNSQERPLSELYPHGHWNGLSDKKGNKVNYKKLAKLVKKYKRQNYKAQLYHDVKNYNHYDFQDSCPSWLKGYWKLNSNKYESVGNNESVTNAGYDKVDKNTYLSEISGIGQDYEKTDVFGFHKISKNKLYEISNVSGYRGYWYKTTKYRYNRSRSSKQIDKWIDKRLNERRAQDKSDEETDRENNELKKKYEQEDEQEGEEIDKYMDARDNYLNAHPNTVTVAYKRTPMLQYSLLFLYEKEWHSKSKSMKKLALREAKGQVERGKYDYEGNKVHTQEMSFKLFLLETKYGRNKILNYVNQLNSNTKRKRNRAKSWLIRHGINDRKALNEMYVKKVNSLSYDGNEYGNH